MRDPYAEVYWWECHDGVTRAFACKQDDVESNFTDWDVDDHIPDFVIEAYGDPVASAALFFFTFWWTK